MKAQFKIDFETFIIAHQTKYPMYFESQTYTNEEDLIYIKFIPISVTRPALNCEQNYVTVRFHLFSDNILTCDKMIDELSALLSERNINGMEFETLSTFQRGNKFDKVWESICEVNFYHWATPQTQIDNIN